MNASLEDDLRVRAGRGDWQATAVAAIQGYGPEILGYLAAVLRRSDEAEEVFASFLEDLWRGLSGFRWESSFRTWAYTLARHALHRRLHDRARDDARRAPLPPDVSAIAERVRTATRSMFRTEVREEVARMRDGLSPDDRELLVLRVSRGLSWGDIAQILEPGGDAPDVARRAAALRKRYERIVGRLRAMSRERGLIE